MPRNPNFPNSFDFPDDDDTKEITEPHWYSSQRSQDDIKRLMGLATSFDTFDDQSKDVYLVSDERKRAYENITTTTMPPKPKAEQKRGIVSEVIKEQLISTDVLKSYPIVYLGSGTDAEYPLAIGGRKIEMVDYILQSPVAQQELLSKIKSLTNQEVQIENNTVNFEFDFGEGKETVNIHLVPVFYGQVPEGQPPSEPYSPPDKVGVILGFAAQGPAGRIEIGDDLKSKLVDGGVILRDTTITKIDPNTNQEQTIELGQKK